MPLSHSKNLNEVTDDLVAYVEKMTAQQGRPLIYLSSAKTSKEETARTVLKDSPVEEGLICTLITISIILTELYFFSKLKN